MHKIVTCYSNLSETIVSFATIIDPKNSLVWISPILIKVLQDSEHIYIDATYIASKEYYQMLVIMAYHKNLEINIPCCYIF